MAWLIRRKQKGKTYLAPLHEQWVEMVAASEAQLLSGVRSMVREHDPDLMVIIEMRQPKVK